MPVKSFLMNSKIIAGVGNIYANEILFASGIHPLTPVREVTLQEWQGIVAACREILQQAIDAGGSTISRITSYNVCYTKLLRNVTVHKSDWKCGIDGLTFWSSLQNKCQELSWPLICCNYG